MRVGSSTCCKVRLWPIGSVGAIERWSSAILFDAPRARHYASLVWYFQFSLGDPNVSTSHGPGSGAHASDEPIVGELRPCPECHEVGLRPLLAEPVLRL
jgi:hypothetical protein